MIGGDKPPRTLGRYTGFLLNWVGSRSRRNFADGLAEIGIHPREFAILLIISEQPGITQQGLGTETDIDASTMVAALDSLEDRGMAERRIHPDDRRKRAVHLTTKGEQALDKAREVAESVGRDSFGRLSAAEQKQLNALLRKAAGLE
jgi:DNA-binding MarR family transcriptional regulator